MGSKNAPRTSERTDGTPERTSETVGRELRWLAPGLIAGGIVAAVYVLTHPYPAFGAGLFFLMAERIVDTGYALPETVPYYTDSGVPFAYPPLLFYLLAVLLETVLEPIVVSRVLPPMFTIAALVPSYALAREFDFSRRQAGVAVLLLAVAPPVLQWHVSAGGVVRGGAYLLALVGCYAGCRLFRTGERRWLVATAILAGTTAMAHPLYLVFLLVSLFVFYLAFDRSIPGLVRGAVVGVGGLLISAPWWTTVVATHGWGVYLAAAGTHGGIGEVVSLVASGSDGPVSNGVGDLYLHVPTALAGLYLIDRRHVVLPAWFAAIGLTVGKPRFLFFFGALFAGWLLCERVLPQPGRIEGATTGPGGRAVFSVTLIALVAIAGGALYSTGQLDSHAGSPSLPAFIDDDDREAMAWADEHVEPDARFVVLGDAAEWFPYFARRTMIVSPWGVEWEDADRYSHELELYRDLSRCETEACLTARLDGANVDPEYVYVPRGTYTVRGIQQESGRVLVEDLRSSDRYRPVYENDGVVIFRMND